MWGPAEWLEPAAGGSEAAVHSLSHKRRHLPSWTTAAGRWCCTVDRVRRAGTSSHTPDRTAPPHPWWLRRSTKTQTPKLGLKWDEHTLNVVPQHTWRLMKDFHKHKKQKGAKFIRHKTKKNIHQLYSLCWMWKLRCISISIRANQTQLDSVLPDRKYNYRQKMQLRKTNVNLKTFNFQDLM